MVEMAVPDDDCIGFFDVGCGKSQRRIILAPIEIGIQQYDLAFVGKLEIRKARPAHDQRMRILRAGPPVDVSRSLRQAGSCGCAITSLDAIAAFLSERGSENG